MAIPLPLPAIDQPGCPPAHPILRAAARTPVPPPDPLAPTYVSADEIRSLKGGVSEFLGNVVVTRGGEHVSADRVRYDALTGLLEAEHGVTLEGIRGDRYDTESLTFNLETREGRTGPGTYRFSRAYARGDVSQIEFGGPDRTLMHEARYTTCPIGQDSWFLKAKEIEIDNAEEVATVRHASVRFQDVPIFYLPYLSFSIADQRKSGFLIPQLGYKTKQGLIAAAPYYLNLAPDYDATVTPRYMSQRGLMLQNEFRYLGRSGGGQATLDVLPNDKRTGHDRTAGTYRHRDSLSPYWSTNIDLRGVSDKEYLDDFGDHLGITSESHLPETATLAYGGQVWRFDARLTDYQTVDRNIAPADRPYARLPQFTLSTNPSARTNELRYHLESEAVRFERDASVTGTRLNLAPAVSLPLASPYGFLTPKLGARHIAYSLSNTVGDTTPTTTRGFFSLDSGLFFERATDSGGRGLLQTLEPRLFYLYVPAKNQDALPNFDTGVPDFNFASLFREQRFVGGDRIGDANQITAAVTSRFIDDADGVERLRLSLGETFYFDDRTVNVPAATDTRDTSDLAAEATAWLGSGWYLRASTQWSRTTDRTERGSYYVQHQPDKDRIFNVGYRYTRDQIHQSDISTEWPLSPRWTVRARSLYSLRDHRNVETYGGLEYRECCWALRVFAGQRYTETSGQVLTFVIQLELTGLSRLGHSPESPLMHGLFFPPAPGNRSALDGR